MGFRYLLVHWERAGDSPINNLFIILLANLFSGLFGPNYSRGIPSAADQMDPMLKLGLNSKVYGFVGKRWLPEQHCGSVRKEEWEMQNEAATSRALHNEPLTL